MIATALSPRAQNQVLDTSPEAFGWFRDSSDAVGDVAALRERLDAEGYLYLPGLLDRGLALETRGVVLKRLASNGHLHCAYPRDLGVAARDNQPKLMPDLTGDNTPLRRLLYDPDGPMMRLYAALFGEPVRHFDHTWMRTIGPGLGTPPHCDSVYMGRGSGRLLTSWVPLGDISLDMGGLLLLEGSHRHERLRRNYCRRDVDTFCANRLAPGERPKPWSGPVRDGWLTRDPVRLRRAMGLRWLTAERFRAGDVVVFSVFAVHGSLDNASRYLRLSADARYQPASDPADQRWIGANPPGHDRVLSRGVIC